ncbi:isochorismatase family protein [Klenkia sp. PcliD-1-E]|uniref:isochorismatase family protein n=1 Tax=Klenkia sp. PcliD-1-E TaxID=2954492 RepID=UPI0020973930|nr:isochorismatase family protein [Klenkia sp. PcliD-1-E]MCO7221496.1 isochorismatase family protein [Klenkia sp. PcliD-1-E]
MAVSSLDPARTALVVVDLQRGVVSRDVGPHPADTVLENALQLAEAFRSAGAPVVLVQADPGDKPPADADVRRTAAAPPLGDVVAELAPLGDLVVVKRGWSAFHGTDLSVQLRGHAVDTVVLVGIATNMGVESTARDAREHGFAVVVVEDAMSSTDAVMHEFAVARIFPLIARVTTTAGALAALG